MGADELWRSASGGASAVAAAVAAPAVVDEPVASHAAESAVGGAAVGNGYGVVCAGGLADDGRGVVVLGVTEPVVAVP